MRHEQYVSKIYEMISIFYIVQEFDVGIFMSKQQKKVYLKFTEFIYTDVVKIGE